MLLFGQFTEFIKPLGGLVPPSVCLQYIIEMEMIRMNNAASLSGPILLLHKPGSVGAPAQRGVLEATVALQRNDNGDGHKSSNKDSTSDSFSQRAFLTADSWWIQRLYRINITFTKLIHG